MTTNRLGVVLGGAALVLLLVILGVRRRVSVVAAEESLKAQLEAQERANERAAAERFEQEKRDRVAKDAAMEAAMAKTAADERAAAIAAAVAMTPQQREDRLRAACLSTCSDSDPAIAGAPPAERKQLIALAARLRRDVDIERRKNYARGLELAMLEKHMNPRDVSTGGPQSTTLKIEGWFCSRQWMYDMMKGDIASTSRSIGFKVIRCDSALEYFEQEL